MSLKKIFIVAGIISAVVMIPYACKTTQKPALDCSAVEASYSKDIAPIVSSNCMPCHKAGSLHGDFTTYEGLNKVAKDGDLEFHVLQKQDMPPNGPLPEDARKKIRCWLNNGSMNN